ncbi:RNA-binding protein 34-like [Lytechinus pictus]|uniref:RNA-binding protein 34-like n=1 Tax=Lytechinus pictus TaxID=7653 RepID=UPI0030B9CDD4
MEGKQKRKRTKKEKKKKADNQSGDDYVPGSIANFLGSDHDKMDQHQSGSKALSSFFQPSMMSKQSAFPSKAGKDAPKGKVTKDKTNIESKSEEETFDEGETKILLDESRLDGELSEEAEVKDLKRKAQDDDDEDVGPKKKRKPLQEPMDPAVLDRTVFVGNLPVNIKKNELKGLFKSYGTIESVRFRSMGVADPSMSKKVAAIKQELNPKRTSFNAYIVFEEEKCAQAALESNGRLVNKHHMRVDIASNNKKHDMKHSLFIGNLPFNIDDEAVRNHFQEFGTVQGVRLIRDKATGMGKGFGYVLFEDSSSVEFALKMDGSKLKGRSLRVKRAVKKEKQKEQRDSNTRGKSVHRRSNSKSRGGSGFQGKAGPRRPQSKGKVKRKQKAGGSHKGKQKR